MIRLDKNPNRLSGYRVQLIFKLTQHCRDEELIRSLVDYLECGRAFIHKEAVNLEVTKLSDLTDKILPFFQKYRLEGVKQQDFIYFVTVLELMKDKTHLTQEGIDQIQKIKLSLYKEIIFNEQSYTATTVPPSQGTRRKSNKPSLRTATSTRRTYGTMSFVTKPLGGCQSYIRYCSIKFNFARLISSAPQTGFDSMGGKDLIVPGTFHYPEPEGTPTPQGNKDSAVSITNKISRSYLGSYLAGLIEGQGNIVVHNKDSNSKIYRPKIIIAFLVMVFVKTREITCVSLTVKFRRHSRTSNTKPQGETLQVDELITHVR